MEEENYQSGDQAAASCDAPLQPLSTGYRATTSDVWSLAGGEQSAREREDNRYCACQREQRESQSHVSEQCSDLLRKQDEYSNIIEISAVRSLAVEARVPFVTPTYRGQCDIRVPNYVSSLSDQDGQQTYVEETDGDSTSVRLDRLPTMEQQSTPIRACGCSVLGTLKSASPLEEDVASTVTTSRHCVNGDANTSKTEHNVSMSGERLRSMRYLETTDGDRIDKTSEFTDENSNEQKGKRARATISNSHGSELNVVKPMFEAVTTRQEESDSEKCVQLQQALQGEAMQVLGWTEPRDWTFHDLKREVKTHFGEIRNYGDTFRRMLEIKRAPGQSLHEFANEIHTLSREADMTNEERERTTRQAFMTGLIGYPGLRGYLEQEYTRRTSLRTAVELAVKYEKEHCTYSIAKTTAEVTTEKTHENDIADVNQHTLAHQTLLEDVTEGDSHTADQE